jgi:hypothetical protein
MVLSVILICGSIALAIIAIGLGLLLVWTLAWRTVHEEENAYNLDALWPPRLVTLYAHGHASAPSSGLLYTSGPIITLARRSKFDYIWNMIVRTYVGALLPRLPLLPGTLMAVPCVPFDLGGKLDGKAYAEHVEVLARTGNDLVLFGTSRGGATVFNALVQLRAQPDWEIRIRPHIKAVVLFGAFGRAADAAYHRFPAPIARMALALYRKFGTYDPQWDPLALAREFPSGLRVVVVAARADPVVPSTTSKELANAIGAEFVMLEGDQHNYVWLEEAARKELMERLTFLRNL